MTGEYTHAGGVVIRSDGDVDRFLLVTAKRDDQEWVLPKGHIDAEEAPEEAAIREVREESGVEAAVVDVAGVCRFETPRELVSAVYFLMEFHGQGESEEQRRIRWCTADEGIELLTFEDARRVVRRAFELMGKARK